MPEIRNDEHEQQEFDNQILQESPIPSKHDGSNTNYFYHINRRISASFFSIII